MSATRRRLKAIDRRANVHQLGICGGGCSLCPPTSLAQIIGGDGWEQIGHLAGDPRSIVRVRRLPLGRTGRAG